MLASCSASPGRADPARPPVNPFLSAPTYGITHMDSAQTDTFPYEVPRGTFRIDPRTAPRSAGGPINIMTLASTSPDHMWLSSTSGVRYLDVSDPDRLVDVLAGGPVLDPPRGMERFEWDPPADAWRSVWSRADVVATSMVPGASGPSGMVMVNGYTKADGWEVTGLDWGTGDTVQRVIFGQDNLGNGAYALIQYLPDGDLLFNGIGGSLRAKLG